MPADDGARAETANQTPQIYFSQLISQRESVFFLVHYHLSVCGRAKRAPGYPESQRFPVARAITHVLLIT